MRLSVVSFADLGGSMHVVERSWVPYASFPPPPAIFPKTMFCAVVGENTTVVGGSSSNGNRQAS